MELVDGRFSPLEIFRAKKYAEIRVPADVIDENCKLKRALDATIAQEWCRLSVAEKSYYLDQANQLTLVYMGKTKGYDRMKRVIKESECFKEINLAFDLDRRRGLARICCSEVEEDASIRIYRVQVPHPSTLRKRDAKRTPEAIRARMHRRKRNSTGNDVSPRSVVLSRSLRMRGLDPEQSRRRHVLKLRSENCIDCLCPLCVDH